MKNSNVKVDKEKYSSKSLQQEIDDLHMQNKDLRSDILLLEEKIELIKKDRDKYRKLAGYR
jgi:hypothetical protein